MVVRAEKIEFIFLHLISIVHCTVVGGYIVFSVLVAKTRGAGPL